MEYILHCGINSKKTVINVTWIRTIVHIQCLKYQRKRFLKSNKREETVLENSYKNEAI